MEKNLVVVLLQSAAAFLVNKMWNVSVYLVEMQGSELAVIVSV